MSWIMKTNLIGDRIAYLLSAFVLLCLTEPAYSASTGLPWEGPLTTILSSIQGPVLQVASILGVIGAGLTLMFGDMGGGAKLSLKIVFGISIMLGATQIVSSLFGFSGGALIS